MRSLSASRPADIVRRMAEGVASVSRARALTPAPRVRVPIRSTIVAIGVLGAISVISFPSAGGAQSADLVLGASGPSPRVAPLRNNAVRELEALPSTARPVPPVDVPPVVVRAAVLTPEGTDGYNFDAEANTVTVSAPPQNQGGNLRAVFWKSDAAVERDATTCATWASESSDRLQQGAALRISPRRDGSVRAITLTKNVYPYGSWIFNVHVWDSASGRMQGLASISLESALSIPGSPPIMQPLPWRVCARVQGSTLRFKAWRLAEREPAWGDRRSGGSVKLPSDAPSSGYSGWYAGHLRAGMTATYADLEIAPVIFAAAPGAVAR